MVSEAWSVKNDEGGIAPSRRRCQQCCPSRRRYRCACYEGDSSWIHAPLLTHPTAVCALESGGHDWWEAASVHRGLSGPCWACTARRAYHLLADSPSVTWWMVCACAEAAARKNTAKLRSIRSRLWQRGSSLPTVGTKPPPARCYFPASLVKSKNYYLDDRYNCYKETQRRLQLK